LNLHLNILLQKSFFSNFRSY